MKDIQVPVRQTDSSGAPVSLEALASSWNTEQQTVLVFGDVGSGKSELMARTSLVVLRAAENDPDAPLPLLIEARQLVGKRIAQTAKDKWPMVNHELTQLFSGQSVRWCVFVDGLDEAGSAGVDAVASLKNQLDARLQILVVASRPILRPAWPGASEIGLSPWTTAESDEFLCKWEKHDFQTVSAIRRSPQGGVLSNLLKTPLTATLCVLAASSTPACLRSRAALYDEVIVNHLFQQWAANRVTTGANGLQWDSVAPVLRKLALETVSRQRSTITKEELTKQLRGSLPDRRNAAQNTLEFHLGILVPKGDAYDFAIRGIAEHLAGRELLERGDDAVVEAAAHGWAAEAVRHAVGWAALGTDNARAVGLLRALLRDEEQDNVTITNSHLRHVLVAVRAAADVGEVAAPIAEQLIRATVRRLSDETSVWVGERVADAVRELAMAGGPCFHQILSHAVARVCDLRYPRRAWYAGQTWDRHEPWADALFDRDSDVRSLATSHLSKWVDVPGVREQLYWQLLDTQTATLRPPSAVSAGIGLRQARRDNRFVESRDFLIKLLEQGGQVIGGAAALALHPSEADPEQLAAAMMELAQGFEIPRAVVQEFASVETGAKALDKVWPNWQNDLRSSYPINERSVFEGDVPPASAAVRARIIKAIIPGVIESARTAWEPLLKANGPVAAAEAICAVMDQRPEFMAPLRHAFENHRFVLPRDAMEVLGRAAGQHGDIKQSLLDLWQYLATKDTEENYSPTWRQGYPGAALEPLVFQGDSESIRVYAEWLPWSPGVMNPTHAGSLAKGIMQHPEIMEAGRKIVDDTWNFATVGRPSNFPPNLFGTPGSRPDRPIVERMYPPRAAWVLHLLSAAWQDDMTFRHTLSTTWLESDNREQLVAALIALEGIPLLETEKSLISRRIKQYFESPHANQYNGSLMMRFMGQSGIASDMADLLRARTERTLLACHAAAALLPLLKKEDGVDLSRHVASKALSGAELSSIDNAALDRLINAAPDAWADEAERAISTLVPGNGNAGRIFRRLPADRQQRVASAWKASAGGRELPWQQDLLRDKALSRVADSIREVLFDLELEA